MGFKAHNLFKVRLFLRLQTIKSILNQGESNIIGHFKVSYSVVYVNCNEKLNRDSIFYYLDTKEFQIQIIYDRKGTKTSENELNWPQKAFQSKR